MDCVRCGTKFDSFAQTCPQCDWDPDIILDEMAGYHTGDVVRNRYEIRDSLGVGCFGSVLRAVDLDVGIEVALKVLHPGLVPGDLERKRFVKGIRPITKLKHKGLARLYHADRDERGRCFLVRELIDGVPLRRLIEGRRVRGDVFTLKEVLPIVEQISELLALPGVGPHCALSPDRMWIQPEHLKLTGMGTARCLPGGVVWHRLQQSESSPGYVAPELEKVQPVTNKSDVFSLGVLVGEMLTQVSYDGSVETFCKAGTDLMNGMDAFFRCALNVHPESRYDNVAELMSALEDILSEAQALSRPSYEGSGLSALGMILPESEEDGISSTLMFGDPRPSKPDSVDFPENSSGGTQGYNASDGDFSGDDDAYLDDDEITSDFAIEDVDIEDVDEPGLGPGGDDDDDVDAEDTLGSVGFGVRELNPMDGFEEEEGDTAEVSMKEIIEESGDGGGAPMVADGAVEIFSDTLGSDDDTAVTMGTERLSPQEYASASLDILDEDTAVSVIPEKRALEESALFRLRSSGGEPDLSNRDGE